MHGGQDFLTRVLRGVNVATYPLSYPDPAGEFYGYDTIRISPWYPPGTARGLCWPFGSSVHVMSVRGSPARRPSLR